jgi:hypothetical protein
MARCHTKLSRLEPLDQMVAAAAQHELRPADGLRAYVLQTVIKVGVALSLRG